MVYLLYLLFQLKSHAYIYESTPQQRIDEESHPGVLADILSHNSVSDSSSSSDGSDTDHSSTSHARAKRIRKAFKRRKRRKSDSIESQRLASDQNVHPTESPSYSSVGHQPSSCAGIDPASNTCSGDRLIKVDFESSSACHPIMSSIAEHPRATPNTPCTNSKKKLKTDNKGDQSVRETEPINAQTNGYHHRRVGFAGPAAAQKNPRRPLGLREASRNRISQLNIPILQSRPSSSRSVRYERPLPGRSGSGNQRIIRRTTSLPDRLPASSGYLSTAPAIRPLPHLMPLAPSSDSSDSDSHQEQKPHLSRLASLILLLVSTGLVAACAEFLVDSIDYFVKNTGTSQAFIGLIILPVVGNAAEHVTAVTMASKNKMDLAIGVALGSSIQIALFVTPITVLLGWCLKTDMSLYFSLLETVSLFASAFITNYLMLDGRTNYLEGALLVAAYVIIAVAAFFFPSCDNLSSMSVPADAKVC